MRGYRLKMAQRATTISKGDANRIVKLRRDLGDKTFRTMMTGGNQRLMRPERASNLAAGSGKLRPWERERLAVISRNSAAIKALKGKREVSSGKEYQVNRALRNWVVRGKDKDTDYGAQSPSKKRSQQKAIKALKFLGIDPTEKHYYVRKVAA
jgi:hypothetical protein